MGLIIWNHFYIVYVAGVLKDYLEENAEIPDEEIIEERRVKMKGNRKKKKMVIPQELQIQKMIRPTHGIVIVKSVKRRASNKSIAAKGEQ